MPRKKTNATSSTNSEDDAFTKSPIPTMGEQPEPSLNHLLDVMTKLLQSTQSQQYADKEAHEEEKKKEHEESKTRQDAEVARRRETGKLSGLLRKSLSCIDMMTLNFLFKELNLNLCKQVTHKNAGRLY